MEDFKKMFKSPKKVSEPTYHQDVIGDINKFDERDIVFARTDLFEYFGEESQTFREYYARHPELLNYDKKVNKISDMGKTGGIDKPMFEAQFEIADKISTESFVDGKPADNQVEMSPDRAREKVKAFAKFLGADLVGIGPLNQEWVYSHSARSHGNRAGYVPRGTPNDLNHHTNAIAIAVRQDYEMIQSAPDFPVLLATAKGYALSAWVSVQLAEFIRMLGYSARASHFHNYRVLTIPVAVDCGLGELSRAGFLLTKEYGLAVRLAIVTTDFPMTHDGPIDIGVQSFCEVCQICAEECPIGAIPIDEKSVNNGVLKWKLDEQKCYRYWQAVGTDCAVCMTSCPWTKSNNAFHRSIAWLASVKGPHQKWLTQADRMLYGRHRSAPRPEFLDSYPTRGKV